LFVSFSLSFSIIDECFVAGLDGVVVVVVTVIVGEVSL
jgi:hypothetical protein